MKKAISLGIFLLTVIIFIFGLFFAVDCSVEVKNNMDKIVASGAGGMERMFAGQDILFIGVFLISAVGLAFSSVSVKIAKYRLIKNISVAMIFLFVLMLLSSFFLPFLYLI